MQIQYSSDTVSHGDFKEFDVPEHMHVCIDETGQQCAARGIDDCAW
jgi:hypothetical protein